MMLIRVKLEDKTRYYTYQIKGHVRLGRRREAARFTEETGGVVLKQLKEIRPDMFGKAELVSEELEVR